MPNYGTMMLRDLLATTTGQIAQFGPNAEQLIWGVFQRSLDAHNRQMQEMVDLLCYPTTERILGAGGVSTGDFEELAEDEVPRPQKVVAGENLGIPLRNYGHGQQWTDLFLEESSPADIAGNFLEVLDADKRNVINQINRSFYLSSNYTSVDIRKKDRANLAVKRLANADGFSIPPGPNGETFPAASHTHYVARASTFAASDLDALITNASEHYTGPVQVFLNAAQEAAVKAFTGFQPTVDVRVRQADTTSYALGGLDFNNRGDRFIGVYNGAEFYVKPWAIANYLVALNLGAPKPLAFRTRNGTDQPSGGLRPLYQQRGYPLNNRGWGREFGVAVTGRVSLALLYIGGTSWADPSLAAAY